MSVNYSFIKTPEEIATALQNVRGLDFYEQEKIQVFWTIDAEVARKVLPPHLEPYMPTGRAIMMSYISFFGRPKFLYPYTEGALFMFVLCGDRFGLYCLAMPLDGNDQAMDAGRQFYGYPKKQAFVKLERRGDRLIGYIERNDVRYFEVEFTIGEPANDSVYGPLILGEEGPAQLDDEVFLLKYDTDLLDGEGLEGLICNARLVAQRNLTQIFEKKNGRVERMEFRPSEDDPWIELAPPSPDCILGGQYIKYQTCMKPSSVLYNYTEEEHKGLAPYLWAMWDTSLMGKEHRSHRTENFWR